MHWTVYALIWWLSTGTVGGITMLVLPFPFGALITGGFGSLLLFQMIDDIASSYAEEDEGLHVEQPTPEPTDD